MAHKRTTVSGKLRLFGADARGVAGIAAMRLARVSLFRLHAAGHYQRHAGHVRASACRGAADAMARLAAGPQATAMIAGFFDNFRIKL
jgi:hypothetical protein